MTHGIHLRLEISLDKYLSTSGRIGNKIYLIYSQKGTDNSFTPSKCTTRQKTCLFCQDRKKQQFLTYLLKFWNRCNRELQEELFCPPPPPTLLHIKSHLPSFKSQNWGRTFSISTTRLWNQLPINLKKGDNNCFFQKGLSPTFSSKLWWSRTFQSKCNLTWLKQHILFYLVFSLYILYRPVDQLYNPWLHFNSNYGTSSVELLLCITFLK